MQLNGSLIAAQQRLSSSSLDNMIVDQHLAVGMHVVAEKDDLTALSTNANHFSKRDPGDEWMEMDVHICLDNVLDMIGSEIDSNTQIKKLYGNLPLIQCVPARISQLILSLLMNACQVTNSERIITIRTGIHTNEKENEEEIWIEIADNGKGVPEENNSQIFDPFFIATLAGSGIGMGLPLSYHIIHQHHGRITMESEPGKSSVFNIWLPLLSKRREE